MLPVPKNYDELFRFYAEPTRRYFMRTVQNPAVYADELVSTIFERAFRTKVLDRFNPDFGSFEKFWYLYLRRSWYGIVEQMNIEFLKARVIDPDEMATAYYGVTEDAYFFEQEDSEALPTKVLAFRSSLSEADQKLLDRVIPIFRGDELKDNSTSTARGKIRRLAKEWEGVETVQKVMLECGHWFHFQYYAPDNLTFCIRCQDYKMPDVMKVVKKRTPNAAKTGRSGNHHMSKEQKALALKTVYEMTDAGRTLKEVADVVDVHPDTVKKWLIQRVAEA